MPAEVVAMTSIAEVPSVAFEILGITDLEFKVVVGGGGLELAGKGGNLGLATVSGSGVALGFGLGAASERA